MGTPRAVIGPMCRADGSVRQPMATRAPDSRCASLTACWSASHVWCSPVSRATAGGMAIACLWSMVRDAPCPSPPVLQATFGQSTEQRPGCGFPMAHLLGLCHAGTGVLLKLVVAPLLTHDLAHVQAVHPRVHAGDVLVADWGLWSYAHLALLMQAGVHAVLRLRARQSVDVTPGRPLVRPGVRRTPAVNGIPRSRWLKALGVQDQLVMWFKPQTCPSWLPREALAALPEALALREGRYRLDMPGFRTREMTLVTTRLEAQVYRMADLAALVPPTLAGRNRAGAPQDHDADGGAARSNGRRRVEGIARLCARLPPGPDGHGPIGHPSTQRCGAAQCSRYTAVARRAEHWDSLRSLACQPHPTASPGAARQEAPPQAFPLDDHTSARTASAADPASTQRLTSCHSALGRFW
jgi:hypothetical protein